MLGPFFYLCLVRHISVISRLIDRLITITIELGLVDEALELVSLLCYPLDSRVDHHDDTDDCNDDGDGIHDAIEHGVSFAPCLTSSITLGLSSIAVVDVCIKQALHNFLSFSRLY